MCTIYLTVTIDRSCQIVYLYNYLTLFTNIPSFDIATQSNKLQTCKKTQHITHISHIPCPIFYLIHSIALVLTTYVILSPANSYISLAPCQNKFVTLVHFQYFVLACKTISRRAADRFASQTKYRKLTKMLNLFDLWRIEMLFVS